MRPSRSRGVHPLPKGGRMCAHPCIAIMKCILPFPASATVLIPSAVVPLGWSACNGCSGGRERR